jgi:hypothetical protein
MLCIFAWWPDDVEEHAKAKTCMLQQWRQATALHGVFATLQDIDGAVKVVEAQFFICMINGLARGPDEVVCTLQQAQQNEL